MQDKGGFSVCSTCIVGMTKNQQSNTMTTQGPARPNTEQIEQKPVKYMTRSKHYRKECSVKVHDINVKRFKADCVIKAAENVCGENTILAVVPNEGENSYEVTTDTEQNALRLTRGLVINSNSFDCTFQFNEIVMVSFLHLPAHIPDSDILDKLTKKGCEIRSEVYRRVHPGTQIADGTRYVKVKFPPGMASLSWSMKFDTGFGERYFKVVHNNQRALCNMCQSPFHKYRQCPELICHGCDEQGHKISECRAEKCSQCNRLPMKCFCPKVDLVCPYCKMDPCDCKCDQCKMSYDNCKCTCDRCGKCHDDCKCDPVKKVEMPNVNKANETVDTNDFDTHTVNVEVHAPDSEARAVGVESHTDVVRDDDGGKDDRVSQDDDEKDDSISTDGDVSIDDDDTEMEGDDMVDSDDEKERAGGKDRGGVKDRAGGKDRDGVKDRAGDEDRVDDNDNTVHIDKDNVIVHDESDKEIFINKKSDNCIDFEKCIENVVGNVDNNNSNGDLQIGTNESCHDSVSQNVSLDLGSSGDSRCAQKIEENVVETDIVAGVGIEVHTESMMEQDISSGVNDNNLSGDGRDRGILSCPRSESLERGQPRGSQMRRRNKIKVGPNLNEKTVRARSRSPFIKDVNNGGT